MHVPLLILLGAVSFLAADGRPLPVSAHNCYASNTTENPKLVQALALGIDNIEIDVGWDATSGSLIVGHDATPRPGVAYPDFARSLAPVLEEHFRRVPSGAAPTVLTVDFKTDRPEAVAVFRAFLDAHADWFSSAEKPAPTRSHGVSAESPSTSTFAGLA
jgi:hypothetical protein